MMFKKKKKKSFEENTFQICRIDLIFLMILKLEVKNRSTRKTESILAE